MIAAPRVNAAAWFGLAVAAPLALLGIAAAATAVGLSKAAGFWAAMLLAPAIVLALRSLEVRDFEAKPSDTLEPDLVRAFCLTTGQACGLLFVVAAGAPFSGQSVAVGLAMAAVPLTLAVGSDIWRRIFPPLDAPMTAGVSAARTWSEPWTDIERLQPVVRGPAPRQPLVASEAVAVRMTGGVDVGAAVARSQREALVREARNRTLKEIEAEAELLVAASLQADSQPDAEMPETLAERLERELGPRVRLAFGQPEDDKLVSLKLKSRPWPSPAEPTPGVVYPFRPIRLWTPQDEQPEPRRAVG